MINANSTSTTAQTRFTPAPSDVCGFTLIEVLISAAILLLAMTGILTMQFLSIKITQDAYHRTQATTLAYQMTDYLRASCGQTDQYAGHTFCHSGARSEADDRSCEFDDDSDIASDAGMVENDLYNWWNALDDAELPRWYATVRTSQSSGIDRYHIVVQWDDTRVTEGEEHSTGTTGEDAPTKTSCLTDLFEEELPIGMSEVCLTTIPCSL